ncbi:helix-turn-helix domain-containing protein [Xanthobacter autotrophicus]|uniref:helix-turn-helix domain-containing protein n=1 Tax=Xanthobacter autotrophicus TaxID=280 RepID=UPI00372D4FE7
MGNDHLKPERIRAPKVASILGVQVRTVQAMALRGELPGAAKIGGLWTFDEAALRAWIREKEQWLADRPPPSRHTGMEIDGRDLPLQVAKSVRACEQALQRLRRGG